MNPKHADVYRDGTLGFLQTPKSRRDLSGVAVWAMDNGCFTDAYPGDQAYLDLLRSYLSHRERCLFVCAPDVVGDAEATLGLAVPMAKEIRGRGWPVALVGQDGMEHMDVPWHLFDWLFVGGSTDWKLGVGGRALVAHAKALGKKVHVGRVNSLVRYRYCAHALGADSADGTYLAFGPDVLLPNVLSWVRAADQGVLFGGEGS